MEREVCSQILRLKVLKEVPWLLSWWAIDYARQHVGGTMEQAYLDCRPRSRFLLLSLFYFHYIKTAAAHYRRRKCYKVAKIGDKVQPRLEPEKDCVRTLKRLQIATLYIIVVTDHQQS
jgi:hypothetical protein